MDIRFNLFTVFAIIGIVQLLVLICYLNVGRRPNDTLRFISLFLCALVFDLFHRILIDTRLILEIPFFIGSGSLFYFIYGPALYLMMRSWTKPDTKATSFWWLHFLPFLINLGIFLSAKSEQAMANDVLNVAKFLKETEVSPSLKYEYLLSMSGYLKNLLIYNFHPFVYTVLSLNIFLNYSQDKRKSLASYLPWMSTLLYGFLVVWIFGELAGLGALIFGADYWFFDTFIVWRPLFVFLILFIALMNPLSRERLKGAKINLTSSENFVHRLESYMNQSKPHKNPNLSRYHLSGAMGVSPDYLTKSLNQNLGVNVREFINTYRVQEVKTSLKQGDLELLTIEAIGMDAGFPSRSTFFRVFKYYVGTTPLIYSNQLAETGK